MYQLQYIAISHPGNVRQKNEDNFYINGEWRRNVENPCACVRGVCEDGHLVASVCDGMGGHEMGETASLYAVEILDTFSQEQEGLFFSSPMEYINEANEKICKLMKQENKRIGTTFSVLEFQRDMVNAVNLGDSRIYRMREHHLSQISEDHTTVARLIRDGLLSEAEAKTYPLRHQVTQHIGIEPSDMILQPAISDVALINNHDIYLICSDGLTDMLMDEQIEEKLDKSISLEDKASQLVQLAVDAGGRDNITVVMIEVCKKNSLKEKIKELFT